MSGSFLFIIGLANSIILWNIVKRRRLAKDIERRRENGEVVEEIDDDHKQYQSITMRIVGPIVTFVNRPWKVDGVIYARSYTDQR